MDLWPAIDIRDGRCVRLLAGRVLLRDRLWRSARNRRGPSSPPAPARLHVVDLDAALKGGSPNRGVVLNIAARAGVPVQAGGGVRDESAASELLEGGVARVVVGTLAVERPAVLARLVDRWPGRVLVGLDHRSASGPNGAVRREVAVHGWVAAAGLELEAALGQARRASPLAGSSSPTSTGTGPSPAPTWRGSSVSSR